MALFGGGRRTEQKSSRFSRAFSRVFPQSKGRQASNEAERTSRISESCKAFVDQLNRRGVSSWDKWDRPFRRNEPGTISHYLYRTITSRESSAKSNKVALSSLYDLGHRISTLPGDEVYQLGIRKSRRWDGDLEFYLQEGSNGRSKYGEGDTVLNFFTEPSTSHSLSDDWRRPASRQNVYQSWKPNSDHDSNDAPPSYESVFSTHRPTNPPDSVPSTRIYSAPSPPGAVSKAIDFLKTAMLVGGAVYTLKFLCETSEASLSHSRAILESRRLF